ncbi:hypothetical protein [Brucella pituitosa]|uniref:Uncharacterized protein n=1 Tax=Brucella pituitosa TaxID=571256 RepID=A0ABS3K5C3_9HYPH|nr:hypothetical protein [Brucella pituitosa]MBO1040986.1 hypothetical protein [Brucella pituitosa]
MKIAQTMDPYLPCRSSVIRLTKIEEFALFACRWRFFETKDLSAVLIERPNIDRHAWSKKRNPFFWMLRYVARVVSALVAGILYAAFLCISHLSYFLLCLFRPVVDVSMIGGVIMLPTAFAAFVKPEVAHGMPYWVFLLMAVGFVATSMGYSRFVDWFAPPDTDDPAKRYRRPDWR